MSPSAVIAQTLHGYREGHGLIAGSAKLDEQSAALMLIMSDLAPRQSVGRDGWLTGYPLPHAERYVLSRTWPAPEMPRPGCVWTHSLVLDYPTLGTSGALTPLLDLLCRPNGDYRRYETVLNVPPREASAPLPSRLFSKARVLIADLYGAGNPRGDSQEITYGIESDADAEQLIFSLWEQQWPRLRRRFRWTTLDAQPSSEVPKFDLVLSAAGESRTRRSGSRSSTERQGWIVAALADLRAGGGDVRTELRRLAIDVQSGRRAFSLLVSTMLLVKGPVLSSSDAHALISLMGRRLRPDEAKFAKGVILAALLRTPERLEGDNLAFALSLLPNLDEPEAIIIARACWEGDQRDFWQRLPQSEAGRAAFDRVLEELPVEDIASRVQSSDVDLDAAVARRPDLLRQAAIWEAGSNIRAQLTTIVAAEPSRLPDALIGLFSAQDTNTARALVGTSGTAAMFATYMDWERAQGRPDVQRTGFERQWLIAAASDENAVNSYLSGPFRLRPSVVTLARLLGPRSFPPSVDGPDVWAESWEHCAGRPVSDDREYIVAFFLYRACHYKARARAEHFALAFGNLLDAFETGLHDAGARALVSDYFSQYGMFSLLERDITKVYRGVARLVTLHHVPIAAFIANGRKRHVEALVEQLRWQPGGEREIAAAIHDLRSRPELKKRIKLLEV